MGVQIDERDGAPEISHGGHIDGYITTLIYYPRSQVSVVILENAGWRSEDIPRAFASHDKLREAVRELAAGP
jgi:hypothetical protein